MLNHLSAPGLCEKKQLGEQSPELSLKWPKTPIELVPLPDDYIVIKATDLHAAVA